MGDSQIGLQARLMSKALRKLTGSLARSQARFPFSSLSPPSLLLLLLLLSSSLFMLYCTQSSVLFINQLRHKVGVLFGSPEITSGGILPFPLLMSGWSLEQSL